ncbi:MAG TPA: CdaR family protein [Candidatus Binataceae bacterium]|jgi:YbbR domain-containing protein|nr:CdaR family protein [Candidatus Binataceae bacterium]
MRLAKIKQFALRNVSLRILAVLIAIGLWFFVNAGQREAQSNFLVPVDYRGAPTGLIIVNRRPDFVNLSISGPRTLLSLLDPGRLTVHLDLRGLTPGQADYKITPDMFRIPRQTTIDRIVPSQITLDVDQIMTREVPVRLSVKGQAASGLAIGSIDLKPSVVTVTGPSHALRNVEAIDTMPFDVQGASEPVSRYVQLADVGTSIRLSNNWVLATVKLQEVVSEREFHDVAVAVKNADRKFLVHPPHISLTVRGPQKRLTGLELDGSVYVDARDLGVGWFEIPVQVDLPKGLEVVHENPDKVKLRLYRAKLEARS